MNWKKILKGINAVADAGNTFNNITQGQESTYGKVMDKLETVANVPIVR